MDERVSVHSPLFPRHVFVELEDDAVGVPDPTSQAMLCHVFEEPEDDVVGIFDSTSRQVPVLFNSDALD